METTWEELATALEVDVRTVHRWRKRPGTPVSADPVAWVTWRAKNAPDSVSSDAALPGECDYDDLVRKGSITYALAKVREQVIAEKVENERKRVELDKARGLLVDAKEAEKAVAEMKRRTARDYDEAIVRAIQRLPAELRADVSRAIEAELA
jgi:aminopeptidase N